MGDQWDVICVGAGITTLAFGAQLVRRFPSTRMLIIDKHAVPGGYATVFHRPKAPGTFDCSLHKLSGIGVGGNLKRILRDLELENDLSLIVPEDYFEAILPDKTIVVENKAEAFESALIQQFPEESEAIHQFFEEVGTHGRNGYYQFQVLDGSFDPDFSQLRYAHRHLKNISVKEALEDRFKNGYLKELIAATGIYVGGYPEDLGYLYFLHVVFATLNIGNAYVSGQSQHLSNVLAKRIESSGGEFLLNTSVTKIIHDDNNQITGVETSSGKFFSKRVYINAAPHYAVENLFSPSSSIDVVKNKLTLLKPSRSTVTVYVTTSLPPTMLGLSSSETMIFGEPQDVCMDKRREAICSPGNAEICERAYWHSSPMEVTNYHKLEPSSGHVICLNILDSIEHWPNRRSAEYKQKKQRAAEIMLERLYVAKPGIRGHIEYVEVSSPRTYQRFTNNTDGAGYGAMVGTDLSAHLFHHNFPYKGVHFLSAWVAGPSYEAAFGYAEMKVKQWAL